MSAHTINFTLNGQPVSTTIEPHRNLVELLQRFDLFGARESCGQGLCGCCTVLVDGQAVSGCLYFAVWADGKSVHHGRTSRCRWRAVERAGGFHRVRGISMRLLHAGIRADDPPIA